ncbi:hypothetical protein C8R43DRAFT_963329 [Mycena crocata]|nr:hypothetical protein C8R43DRAFT_963329 [Mycena crocata]
MAAPAPAPAPSPAALHSAGPAVSLPHSPTRADLQAAFNVASDHYRVLIAQRSMQDNFDVAAVWATLNPYPPSTHQMRPGSRHDPADEILALNWQLRCRRVPTNRARDPRRSRRPLPHNQKKVRR